MFGTHDSRISSVPTSAITMDAKPTEIIQAQTGADVCSNTVVFRSIDNRKFIMLKEQLNVAAGGFPPAILSSKADVQLSKPSDVLKVLFQYVAADTDHHGPTLEHINFFLLLSVAEAAEKYEVYQAIAAMQPEFGELEHISDGGSLCLHGKHTYGGDSFFNEAMSLHVQKMVLMETLPPWNVIQNSGGQFKRGKEWKDRFADLFLPRLPEETSSHYQERLAYGKEIFLHPIIEGLEKIVEDKGIRATGFRLSSISFGAIESLLAEEYIWRMIIHGVTGALVESPCYFDLDNPTSDEDVIDRLQRYYEEFKFIPPSEREEGLPEVLKEEGIDTDSWIAKATPYNSLKPAAISFKMSCPPIVSPEMITYCRNAIRSGTIVTGQLLDEETVSIPDSIF
ncbi:uncharacterized protein C8R40DRAFT_1073187 [Lentinula edodes]|uniref:uncharacterized protein n=1 Tax=Lentinula edodes TaxID=5353 RepID=UPI001E8CB99A|nr:uncharacterized protein C8R40DRAFT_1073187 [Lentinula edodes]KAH7870677.1 hypothetical protein C8R40DRAFT_1073187 [Lentinula edodes]